MMLPLITLHHDCRSPSPLQAPAPKLPAATSPTPVPCWSSPVSPTAAKLTGAAENWGNLHPPSITLHHYAFGHTITPAIFVGNGFFYHTILHLWFTVTMMLIEFAVVSLRFCSNKSSVNQKASLCQATSTLCLDSLYVLNCHTYVAFYLWRSAFEFLKVGKSGESFSVLEVLQTPGSSFQSSPWVGVCTRKREMEP